jgi:hypothetical protein
VLAIVAMATAFSGYQGTQWGGEQARCMGWHRRRGSKRRPRRRSAARSSWRTRLPHRLAPGASSRRPAAGGDVGAPGSPPDYAEAFREWLATDPFTDPDAPPGPAAMPGYSNPINDEGREAERSSVQVLRCRHGGTGDRQQVRSVHGAVRVRAVPRGRRTAVPVDGALGSARTRLALALLAYTVYGVASLPRI